MAAASSSLSTKRYAVVTGANKGIGYEISKQLTSNGVIVVLTARDENKGIEAANKIKELGLSDLVIFHQLDVTNPQSIASLADFVKTQFGKLDILVNNAGISGAIILDHDAYRSAILGAESFGKFTWSKITSQPYNVAQECLETNYYGAKRMTEALMPLLLLSNSPRIVNISSIVGKLQYLENEWAKEVLSDIDNLTEDKIDEVIITFLKDSKDGSFADKGWNPGFAAYYLSKATLNAYTRVMAKKWPCVCMACSH